MDRDKLELLLSGELDGTLSAAEQAELSALLRDHPEARRLAESWRRTERDLKDYAETLGAPRPFSQLRTTPAQSDRPRWLSLPPMALAAAVFLAFGIGLVTALWLRAGQPSQQTGFAKVPLPPRGAAPDETPLRQALSETWQLMPRQVSFAALQSGKLQVGTLPLAMENTPEHIYLVTFFTGCDAEALKLVCQVAVLEGEVARIGWEDSGRWELQAHAQTPVDRSTQLVVVANYQPANNTTRLTLSAAALVTDGVVVQLASSRLGSAQITLWAKVSTIRTQSLASGRGAP
ncbi:MAG: hypothetical protein NTW87_07710 [Planctomycetota bacterium]|nr:hypothetical protein [Planctomycetota bacterium]